MTTPEEDLGNFEVIAMLVFLLAILITCFMLGRWYESATTSDKVSYINICVPMGPPVILNFSSTTKE